MSGLSESCANSNEGMDVYCVCNTDITGLKLGRAALPEAFVRLF